MEAISVVDRSIINRSKTQSFTDLSIVSGSGACYQ
jgi:hypothetical protein